MEDINGHVIPDDIPELKKLIASRDEIIESFTKRLNSKEEELEKERLERERGELELEELKKKYEDIERKYKYLHNQFFGRRSEKLTYVDELQGSLFNEAEVNSGEEEIETAEEIEGKAKAEQADITIVKQHMRKKAGRKPIPDDFPAEEIIHDLSEEEKTCECCQKQRPLIGQEESKELEIIPEQITVKKHIRLKYGPCNCDGFLDSGKPEVTTASAPARMLPGSIAGEGLLSYVLISKFCDALPFYRLSKMFERIDVDISRATMCNWTIRAYERIAPLFEVMKETLKSGEFIRMDETTVQVLHEEGRAAESKSFMWVAIGYPVRGKPLVLYEYHPTRSGKIPLGFLEGFKGYLQTDGYKAYDKPALFHGLIHVGCFAHARREFYKAYNPKSKNKRAYKALIYIRRIYEIESSLRGRNLQDDKFIEKRKKQVLPVLDEFYKFLLQTKDIVTPSSDLGKAVSYTLNEWVKLVRYLDKAYLTPDNNEIERVIKPFVIGRKNWLFSNTSRGAEASAGMYSLIESAKANGHNPYHYLRYLFSQFPNAGNDREKLKQLLPCYLSEKDMKSSG